MFSSVPILDVCEMKNNLFSAAAFNFPLNELIDWKSAHDTANRKEAGGVNVD